MGAATIGVAVVSVALGVEPQLASSASASTHNHGLEYLRIGECQRMLFIIQNPKRGVPPKHAFPAD
jgi:hypothetical protein